jgi:hypothetical protein
MTCCPRLVLLACLWALSLPATEGHAADAPAAAPKLEIGINRTQLSAQGEAVKEKTLNDIHRLGATWFRDGPTSGSARGVANFVDEVRRAKGKQLKVLVIIGQMDSDYDHPEALPNWRIGNRVGWKEKKLSRINLDKFAQRLRTLFAALKAADLSIDAVEFGSEDDSYPYDADVPNGHQATAEEVHTWLRGYAQFLKTGAELLHDPGYFPQAKIITFGIAHGCDTCDKSHLSSPARFVAMLKNVDGFNYLDNSSYHVDGYGTHLYPSPNDISHTVQSMLQQDAAVLGRDKPLWITEWGFLDFKAFPNRKGQTLAEGMQEFLDTLDRLHQQTPMGPAFFYRYDVWLTDSAGNLLPNAAVLSAYTMSRGSR